MTTLPSGIDGLAYKLPTLLWVLSQSSIFGAKSKNRVSEIQ